MTTPADLRDRDARLAVAMGWRDVKVNPTCHDVTGIPPGEKAWCITPRYSESLDAQAPLMAEIRKRGLEKAWVAKMWLTVPMFPNTPPDWCFANAPADVRARACLKVLEGE